MAPIPPSINRSFFLALSSLLLLFSISKARSNPWDSAIRMPSGEADAEKIGTRWAVLVAGSNGYDNYRHQADVCHAYQILKKGGLKEENIVVFMYDDIAASAYNPRPGVIINNPNGSDVYAGVPKDYTGKDVHAKNLYAVLLGKKEEVEGGSGKVVASGPNDRIFIFYSDHGGPGVLGMPNAPFLYANNFIDVLKKKHASGGYKEMVIYVEACESGSIFEGLMPDDINTYVMTASGAEESSWGTYCPGMNPAPPSEYSTCLGDLYSVAWMEDSESHDLRKETIKQQYEAVKDRTSNYDTYNAGSHVMEYGNKSMKSEDLYLYQGFDPSSKSITQNTHTPYTNMEAINQRDADLLFMWNRYKRLEDGSGNKVKILKEFMEILTHRMHLDSSVEDIGGFLFGPQGPSILKAKRPLGRALVDDWGCLKAMVRVFETHCGSLTQYGMKHMRAFANICNKGISKDQMEVASKKACSGYIAGSWSVSSRGHSA